jgi:5-methylcytosine-specific restriction endonuclease McrA
VAYERKGNAVVNGERVLRKAGRRWTALIKVVRDRDAATCGLSCYLCGYSPVGKTGAAVLPMEADHVVPTRVDFENEYDLGNVAMLCRPCNRSKSDSRLPAAQETVILAEVARRNRAMGTLD